jgi:energy-coupling factor transport system ATP-binding protein
MALIELKDTSFTYRGAEGPALKEISLSIEQGEFVGLIGPTGAGKSTLCWVIVGVAPQILLGKIKGEVTVKGLAPNRTPVAEIAQIVGLVQQDAEVQLLMTDIEKEIVFPLENLGLSRPEIERRLNYVLDLVNLRSERQRHPFYLSGGQKQRVAVAAALAMQPEILILDEATSELDPVGAEEVHNLAGLLKKEGKTILMVEHNIDELARHADRIIVMNQGEKVKDGPTREVLSDVDFLTSLGIYPPQVTQVAYHLQAANQRTAGYPDSLPGGGLPLTLEEGVQNMAAAGRMTARRVE